MFLISFFLQLMAGLISFYFVILKYRYRDNIDIENMQQYFSILYSYARGGVRIFFLVKGVVVQEKLGTSLQLLLLIQILKGDWTLRFLFPPAFGPKKVRWILF